MSPQGAGPVVLRCFLAAPRGRGALAAHRGLRALHPPQPQQPLQDSRRVPDVAAGGAGIRLRKVPEPVPQPGARGRCHTDCALLPAAHRHAALPVRDRAPGHRLRRRHPRLRAHGDNQQLPHPDQVGHRHPVQRPLGAGEPPHQRRVPPDAGRGAQHLRQPHQGRVRGAAGSGHRHGPGHGHVLPLPAGQVHEDGAAAAGEAGQVQGAVAAAARGRHQPPHQAVGGSQPLDQGAHGGVLPAGRAGPGRGGSGDTPWGHHACPLPCQGDKEAELGLPFSPLCDRTSTLVAQSQIGECGGRSPSPVARPRRVPAVSPASPCPLPSPGFIDFIVEPTFSVLTDVAEKLVTPLAEDGSKAKGNPATPQQPRWGVPVPALRAPRWPRWPWPAASCRRCPPARSGGSRPWMSTWSWGTSKPTWPGSAPPGPSTSRRTSRSGRRGRPAASPTRRPSMSCRRARSPRPPARTGRTGTWNSSGRSEVGAGGVGTPGREEGTRMSPSPPSPQVRQSDSVSSKVFDAIEFSTIRRAGAPRGRAGIGATPSPCQDRCHLCARSPPGMSPLSPVPHCHPRPPRRAPSFGIFIKRFSSPAREGPGRGWWRWGQPGGTRGHRQGHRQPLCARRAWLVTPGG
ncbi:dual specificity calcium/calmodulin-dependent 3',5'-cyclic nucleotide phosphodiesterase 1B isoform X2 [Poecile atricapillus]|uniref:dual specificity calcium/calmodulin-dependent 3',5'-cyclic nucleotide phosphodiesterase 1B isoform X2 n=1 Tax=Poecile atricapillus TaxID=48891 RepID=UPI002739EADE|nr:dual specificity calcium/calmodulin-dependent 3',5'-cyclic nucleotide phosphodiesterase 1B isoform X2 [Poecile atricapillus]